MIKIEDIKIGDKLEVIELERECVKEGREGDGRCQVQ